MPPFLALIVNDSLFAAVVGTSFTACLALMAWIVKSLITLSEQVETMDIRLRRVEESNGQRSTGKTQRPR